MRRTPYKTNPDIISILEIDQRSKVRRVLPKLKSNNKPTANSTEDLGSESSDSSDTDEETATPVLVKNELEAEHSSL